MEHVIVSSGTSTWRMEDLRKTVLNCGVRMNIWYGFCLLLVLFVCFNKVVWLQDHPAGTPCWCSLWYLNENPVILCSVWSWIAMETSEGNSALGAIPVSLWPLCGKPRRSWFWIGCYECVDESGIRIIHFEFSYCTF